MTQTEIEYVGHILDQLQLDENISKQFKEAIAKTRTVSVTVDVPRQKLLEFRAFVRAGDERHVDIFHNDLCDLYWRALLNEHVG